jgi:parvulin-like peptidyl-prolyl isomerase
MKYKIPLIFSVITCAAMYAQPAPTPQTPAPAAPAEPTKAPAPKPEVAPDTVVASVEGKSLTAAEVDKLIAGLPPQLQQNVQKDRRQFLQQWALFKKISKMAEASKLDEQSPYKERLDYMRMQLLLNAQLEQVSLQIPVSTEEQKKFYEANQDRYTQAKIKVIYIPFTATESPEAPSDPKAKKPLTEAEAKAKAAGIVKQVRGGADFIKMVKEHSEDQASAAKDGDFGQPISRTDSIPEDIKATIFALKPGEVSEPVRQPNGFYVFRLEEISTQGYDEVKDAIFKELKEAGFKQWFEAQQKQVNVKFENESYFAPQAPAPSAAPGR